MTVRSAEIVRPRRPITWPTSSSDTWSSSTSASSSSARSTTTESWSSTRDFVRNARSSSTAGLGDALDAQELLDRVGRLRAVLEPVLRALLVDHDLRGLRLRVVAADRLNHAAVTRRALIGNDDAPDRILLAPHAGESYSYGHKRPGSLACDVYLRPYRRPEPINCCRFGILPPAICFMTFRI